MPSSDYGATLYDQNGRVFASTERETFHYWGCVDVSVNPNLMTVRVFNIPTTIPIATFLHVTISWHNNFVDRGGLVELIDDGGFWALRYRSAIPIAPATVAAFTRARLFVFVPARYINSSSYGLQCFSASGVKTFDSSRPALQICGFASNINEIPNFINRQTTMPASVMNNSKTSTAFVWSNKIYNMRYYASQLDEYGGWGFTMLWDYIYYGNATLNTKVENVALIDGNYYLSFPNLNNYQ